MLATKAGDLSSITKTHIVGGERPETHRHMLVFGEDGHGSQTWGGGPLYINRHPGLVLLLSLLYKLRQRGSTEFYSCPMFYSCNHVVVIPERKPVAWLPLRLLMKLMNPHTVLKCVCWESNLRSLC